MNYAIRKLKIKQRKKSENMNQNCRRVIIKVMNKSVKLYLFILLFIGCMVCTNAQSKKVKFDSSFFINEFKKMRYSKFVGKGRLPVKQIVKRYTLDEKSDTSDYRIEKVTYTKKGYVNNLSIQRNQQEINSYVNTFKKNKLILSIHQYNGENQEKSVYQYREHTVSIIGLNSNKDTVENSSYQLYPKAKSIVWKALRKNIDTDEMELLRQDSLVFNDYGHLVFLKVIESTTNTKYSSLWEYKVEKDTFVYNKDELLESKEHTVLFDDTVPGDTVMTRYEYNTNKQLVHSSGLTSKNWIQKDTKLKYNGLGQVIEVLIFKNRAEEIVEKRTYKDNNIVKIVSFNNFRDGYTDRVDITYEY